MHFTLTLKPLLGRHPHNHAERRALVKVGLITTIEVDRLSSVSEIVVWLRETI
jgi:hypothetical protein